MPKDPELLAHQRWLGYLQPVGLVVSPPALVQSQAFVNADIGAEHARFLEHVAEVPLGEREPVPAIADLKALLTDPALFGWQPGDLVPADDPKAASLEVVLPAFHETLRPSYAVLDVDGAGWLMLIQELPLGTEFDEEIADARHWQTSPEVRFERLLRETGVPIGLLFNRTSLRLVYFPRGESPGHLTFPVAAMTGVAGRPTLTGLLLLLRADRLFTLPDKQRLPALLAESRKYQNTVSTELAEQVLAALFELLRGFQAADDQRKGDVLRDVLAHEPDQVYAGLVTVLMRTIFLLYAEDRGLMSDAEVYVKYYSVTGLFERLREDAGRYPDTMDQRYGAWAQLLALFRLAHDGGKHTSKDSKSKNFELPARHGHLFDPDRFPFLEGRPRGHKRGPGERIMPPLVPDGVLFRVLNNLLVLDGERISYSTLDVEQIGSVYEAIMGYRLERAAGQSIALKPKKAHGAPVTVNLDALLATEPDERGKWLAKQADQKIDGKVLIAVKAAESVPGLVAALERRVASALTPNIVAPGGMVLQPSDERRRSGSHYTPRALTEPIVRKALEPVLSQFGGRPTPEQILALKVCDPAMGSGAFLVEACRQLGDALLKAWVAHGQLPKVPDDETPELFAQRTVAQRCLYGVDRNPMAVDLAKVSLWLATLAKAHPFTFLDHSLRCGDALVGLTVEQIRKFHWKPAEMQQMVMGFGELQRRIEHATRERWVILEGGEFTAHTLKEQKLKAADEALNTVRMAGNLVVAAFFGADNDRKRGVLRDNYFSALGAYLQSKDINLRPTKQVATLREGPHPILPFHWEIEFPEVFQANDGGFHSIVGNPPFLGGRSISTNNGDAYSAWLIATFDGTSGGADLVAHFFRRAFNLLRPGGTFGLIATNTIAQGDTRSSGLRWICTHGGTIYHARRRYKWPGFAAVVVSVIHGVKSSAAVDSCITPPFELDGKPVDRITAYLFHAGGHDNPATIAMNADKSFQGSIVHGMGLTFDDTDKDGVASPLDLMRELIAKDPRNAERIFPYIGGDEVNDSPTHNPIRYVVNFDEMSFDQAGKWPDLVSHLETKSKPERSQSKSSEVREYPWWLFWRPRTELYKLIHTLPAILVAARHQPNWAVTRQESQLVFSEALIVFALPTYAAFTALQSRVHEIWVRFFASSMKDDLRYTPSDCFETFPFPENFESHPELEAAGQTYYEFRADLMVRNNEGLTKTYNRFHDPNEQSPDIARLRELHAAMDRAVLDAYGADLAALTVPPCEFLLDYEDEEDEDSEPGKRAKKKPWRYRWPDAFRDEVLALLLDLNKQRAEQEKLAGPAEKPKKARHTGTARGKKKGTPSDATGSPDLF